MCGSQCWRGQTILSPIGKRLAPPVSGFLPTDQKIWCSVRNKDLSRQVCAYMWKCMHNAHCCGGYWMRIPNYEQCAACRVCDSDKLMEHILTNCHASGQRTVWRLVQELFEKKGIPMPTALVNFHHQKGKPLNGNRRAFNIV